jgi:hypothetical protein
MCYRNFWLPSASPFKSPRFAPTTVLQKRNLRAKIRRAKAKEFGNRVKKQVFAS